MRDNPLAEFGAIPAEETDTPAAPAKGNPLAEFGAVPADEPAAAPNPLAEFGAVPADASAAPSAPAAPPPSSREAYLKASNQVTEQEVDGIAAKYPGVDAAFLKSVAPFSAGVRVETPGQGLAPNMQDVKSVAGILGMTAGNLPQLAFKKMQDPNTRAALDDLKELGDQRKSGLQKVAEGAASLGLGGAALGAVHAGAAVAPTIWRSLAEGAVWGGASGLGESKEGEEVKRTAIGAGMGAALGGVLHGGSKALGAAKKAWTGASTEAMQGVQAKVDQALEQNAAANQESEERIVRVAKGDEPPAAGHVLDKEAVDSAAQRIQQDPEQLDALKEANQDLVADHAASGGTEEELVAELAKRDVYNKQSQETVGFAKYLESGGDLPLPKDEGVLAKQASDLKLSDAAEAIQKKQALEGEDALRKEFRAYKASQAASDSFTEYAEGVQPGLLTNLGRSVLHGLAFFRQLDARAGTTLEPLANEMSRMKNLAARELAQTMAAQAGMRQEVDKAGLRALDIGAVKRLEQGDMSVLTADQRPAFTNWQKAVETNRLRMNELGVPVQQIGEEKAAIYIPSMQVDPATTAARVTALMRSIEKESGTTFAKVMRDADMQAMQTRAPERFGQLTAALKYLSGEEVTSAADLSRLSKQASDPLAAETLTSSKAARYSPGALKAREGQIPDMLRETDLSKLQVRWMAENTKYAYMRDSMRELVKQRNLLQASGDRAGMEYVNQLMQDATGQRATVSKAVRQAKTAAQSAMYQRADAARAAGNVLQANTFRAVGENMDVFQVLASSMYPNLIGLSPHIAMMQLAQPLLMTLPELASGGTAWASAKVFGGMARTGIDLLTGGEFTSRVMKEGYMQPHMSAEILDSFKSGIERGWPNRMLRKAAETYSKVGMAYMMGMEIMNRASCLQMARTIAEDLVGGSESAHRFLSNAGQGYTYQIQKALNSGDKGAAEKLVGDYLIGKTMFHYDSTFTSSAGRQMGPMFSAFTTWPTQIAGDIAADYARRGIVGGTASVLRKHAAPYAVLRLAGAYLKSQGMGPDQSPRAKALFGAEGPAGLAPIASLVGQLKQGHLAPGPDSAVKGLASLMSGDPNNWWHFMNNEVSTFLPGTGLVKLMDTTIPALFFNKEGHDKGATMSARALNMVKPGAGTRLDQTIHDKLGRGGK